MRALLLCVWTLVAALAVSRRAGAADAASAHPLVELALDVAPPDQPIADALDAHLRAELTARHVDVVRAPASRPAIARISLRVERDERGLVRAIIAVHDAVTVKRVERTIDLTSLPADGRPLAVAAATDELLRASWVELTLPDAPPPAVAPPQEVLAALPRHAEPPRFELALDGDLVVFPRRTAIGASVDAAVWLSPRLAPVLGLAATRGLPHESPWGSVRIDTLELSVGVRAAVVDPRRRWGLTLDGALALAGAHLVGAAGPLASAHDSVDYAAFATLLARLSVRVLGVRAELGVGPTIALRGVAGDDGTSTLTSMRGVGVTSRLGVVFD